MSARQRTTRSGKPAHTRLEEKRLSGERTRWALRDMRREVADALRDPPLDEIEAEYRRFRLEQDCIHGVRL